MERGFFPEGFAFDEEGGLWVTSLVSHRLVRFHLLPDRVIRERVFVQIQPRQPLDGRQLEGREHLVPLSEVLNRKRHDPHPCRGNS